MSKGWGEGGGGGREESGEDERWGKDKARCACMDMLP